MTSKERRERTSRRRAESKLTSSASTVLRETGPGSIAPGFEGEETICEERI